MIYIRPRHEQQWLKLVAKDTLSLVLLVRDNCTSYS